MIPDLLAAAFLVAVVYVLVRPRSHAGQLVTAFGSAVTAIVRTATDLATE